MTFDKWFNTFLDEKDLPWEQWAIPAPGGTTNIIDSDTVIEAIRNAPEQEQRSIKEMIVKIDFVNGNINNFFKHLAGALVFDL